MNRHEFETNWSHLKQAIPHKWSKFTAEEVNRLDGRYDPFIGHLQKKYGYSREQAEMEMKNWSTAECSKGCKVEKMPSCDKHEHHKNRKDEKKRKAS